MSTLIVILDALSSPPHRRWLRRFEQRLRSEDLDVFIYEPGAKASSQDPSRAGLRRALARAFIVIPLCSPTLRKRLDEEMNNPNKPGRAMLAPILESGATPCSTDAAALPYLLPVLREGPWNDAIPRIVQNRKLSVIDLRDVDAEDNDEDAPELARLLRILTGKEAAPRAHAIPAMSSAKQPIGVSALQSALRHAVSVDVTSSGDARRGAKVPPTKAVPDRPSLKTLRPRRKRTATPRPSEPAPVSLPVPDPGPPRPHVQDIESELRDSILSVASFLGSEGGSEELYIEMVLQLRFGVGVSWLRRWSRRLSNQGDQLKDPVRREEVRHGLAALLHNGELKRTPERRLHEVAELEAPPTGVSASYARSSLESAFRAATQQS